MAAVCVYPTMVGPAVKALEGSGIPVASVATVAAPSAVAAWCAWRRSPRTPMVVLVAAVLANLVNNVPATLVLLVAIGSALMGLLLQRRVRPVVALAGALAFGASQGFVRMASVVWSESPYAAIARRPSLVILTAQAMPAASP